MRNFVAKVHFSPEERDHIDAQAKALGLSRSELVRLRALGDPMPGSKPHQPRLTLRQYQTAVTTALRASNGACSRNTCEAITAAILCFIYDGLEQNTAEAPKTAG